MDVEATTTRLNRKKNIQFGVPKRIVNKHKLVKHMWAGIPVFANSRRAAREGVDIVRFVSISRLTACRCKNVTLIAMDCNVGIAMENPKRVWRPRTPSL
jgi:hypothetical protein